MHWFFLFIGAMLAPPGAPVPECAGCHRQQAELHARSRHAVAWVNPLFRAEYDEHPKSWCVACHATDVDSSARSDPPPRLARRGVSCQGCHVIDGELVSRDRSMFSIHATRADPSFGSASDCARCHQFNFPELTADRGALIRYTSEPMQNTVSEASAAGLECASCHDPHRAAGSHSVDKVRAAASVNACRDGDKTVVVTIENRGAGHNLPTGGVHRYLAARVWRSSAPARVATLRLGREFGPGDSGSRRTLSDSTIAVGARRQLRVPVAALGGAASEPINIELRYHYAVRAGARLIDGSPAAKTIVRQRRLVETLPSCR